MKKTWLLSDTDGTTIGSGNLYRLKAENNRLVAEILEVSSRFGCGSFTTSEIVDYQEYEGGLYISCKDGAEFWFEEIRRATHD